MVWLVLAACSGGEGSEDSGEAAESCQSVAVASYEVVPSYLNPEMPAALLDPSGSTLCVGDQVVWWENYEEGWYIAESPSSAEVSEGLTLLDFGVPFKGVTVLLALVPEGDTPDTWNPCDPLRFDTCEDARIDRILVDAPYESPED